MLDRAAIASLAAYRITRLITTDTITEPLRARLFEAERAHFDSKPLKVAAYIARCDYCASSYAGGAAALLTLAGDRSKAAKWLALGLAASGAVSLYAENKKAPSSPW